MDFVVKTVLLLCSHTWTLQWNSGLECRVERDVEHCEVRLECDVGSQILVSQQTTINLVDELKLRCDSTDSRIHEVNNEWGLIGCNQ